MRSLVPGSTMTTYSESGTMTTPAECVILDIPDGLNLNLLGVVVEIGRVRNVADRAGLLGGLLASLTCGGPAGACGGLRGYGRSSNARISGQDDQGTGARSRVVAAVILPVVR